MRNILFFKQYMSVLQKYLLLCFRAYTLSRHKFITMNDCSISITTLLQCSIGCPVIVKYCVACLHLTFYYGQKSLFCPVWHTFEERRTFFLFPVRQDRTPTVFGCSYPHIFLFLAKQRFINFNNILKSIHLSTHFRVVRRIYNHFSQHV